VTFIDDDEIEKVAGEISVELLAFLGAGDGLVECEVNFIRGVDAPMLLVYRCGQLNFGAIVALNGLRGGRELRHGGAEGAEVIHHRLIDKDIPVSKEENALSTTCLPKTPDNLESGVGLAGAGGHNEEDPILPLGNGFDGLIDGDTLIITRLLATAVVEVVLEEEFLLLRGQAFPPAVFFPKVVG
jgi:hypothetical protein